MVRIMSYLYIEKFESALANNSLTLDIVREYVEGAGSRLDSPDHHSIVGMFEPVTPDAVKAMQSEGMRRTNVAVGGNLALINWVVEQALDYAADARTRPTRKGAEAFKLKAIKLLSFADTELEGMFPGTKNNLVDQWDVVNAPLPEDGYILDNPDAGLD